MGSGKSRTLLELWKAYFKEELITEAWVICPNSIIDNWWEQIDLWAPELKDRIRVYGILSLSAGRLPIELVQRSHDKLAVAVDESQRIKNSQAKRTHVMQEIGKHAKFRSILTGTPNTKGIEDLYSQYNFLNPDILGFKSFYAFRNRYCIMGGFDNKQIVGYQNLPELMRAVAPFTHVVKDPVKLPPMAHEDRVVKLSLQQKKLLSDLKEQMSMEMAGTRITVDNALAYYTRAAQIIGGFFPVEANRVAYLEDNPKIDELIELVEATDKKIVIFARFIPEARLIEHKLQKYGVTRLGSDIKDRQAVINDFQNPDGPRLFVSTYAMGSIGFTLTRGKILAKYSGTFNYEDEVQSEKRIHRIGQDEETMCVRILADCKLDRHIKAIAQQKQTLADFVSSSLRDPKALLSLLEE
jgi:SNF2 family DNA or RNA helicase